ncbi:hypothetical protein GALMADRAFT_78000 [Galerina marginata CBS 339.88]|uniref:Nephrocystin 3-like N-terminal domain-containing protein n=1 Tax=Galerina marginata (strain CBS 339.88) TaxID=685588 RepID=A0A067SMC8_GALM3|nr:hypothetical protein GALMADRAFT_78000 [Galerina marginata CBS 339.88]
MNDVVVQIKNIFLSSLIIDKLPQPNPSLGIAYFFFDGRDGQTELQLHNKLILSLVSQFSDMRHGGIPVELADLYKNCGGQQPLDHQLQNVLHDILDGFSGAHIVIDALDECTNRAQTLSWINKLVTDQKAPNLHIVVTSRPEPDIKKILGVLDLHSIDIGGETENQDIMKYLGLQMKLKFTKYKEDIRVKIESQLAKSMEGSYVYPHHVFNCG